MNKQTISIAQHYKGLYIHTHKDQFGNQFYVVSGQQTIQHSELKYDEKSSLTSYTDAIKSIDRLENE